MTKAKKKNRSNDKTHAGLKDFFYDNNDYLIAIVVVLIATGLIVWRVHTILQYPQTVANQSHEQTTKVSESASTIETGSAFQNGVLIDDISVTIDKGKNEDAVKDLFDQKLFTDYSQFKKALKEEGYSIDKIHSGTYPFDKGTTVEDVLKTLAG